MEKNFYAPKVEHLINDSTMTLINDKGQQRIRKMHTAVLIQANGIDSKVLIRFMSPADIQGTGYLQIQHTEGDDDVWIYLPALKKVRRLVANNKKDSFFGSDFSYGDILLPVVDTYRHTLVRSEMLDGEDCYVIEAVPATDELKNNYGYGKFIAWVRKSNFMEKKIEYFDISGRPLKTQMIGVVQEVNSRSHKWWAIRREVVNHQTGHRTLLVFDRLDVNASVAEEFFTPRYLEREK